MKKDVLILVSLLCTLSISPAFAQPPGASSDSKPYFFDNFDKGPKPDWNPADGNWTMISGAYTLADITNRYLYFSILEKRNWNDLVLTADVRPGHTGSFTNEAIIFPRITPPVKKSEGTRTTEIGVGGIGFFLDAKYGGFVKAGWGRVTNGVWADPYEVVKVKKIPGESIHVRIEVKGNLYSAYVNDTLVSQIDDESYPSGMIGIGQWYDHWFIENRKIAFDNIWVGPPQYAAAISPPKKPVQGPPSHKAAETTGPDDHDAARSAKRADDAAFKAEKAAFRAEQAARAAQDAARKAEGKAKKVEGMILSK